MIMLRPNSLVVYMMIAALAVSAHCYQGQHAALSLRLESVKAAQHDVLVLNSHVNTPTAPDPRHDGDNMSGISRRVDSALRADDADLLDDMMRQTPDYLPSLPTILVAVKEATEVNLQFTVHLLVGEVTDRLSCLRDALSHSAAAGFCASALPAHALAICCVPLSQAASHVQLGAVMSQVDCTLRQ
jgi:hypothetical protein